MANVSMFTLLFICCFCLKFVSTSANITTTEFLRDSETLLSSNATFKIGFLSTDDSTNRYVGIWYNIVNETVVVWVANRNNPINDTSGVLKISEDGNLQLLDGQNTIFWSSNVSQPANSSSVAQLLDTGNLVLLSTASGMILWQSFEHLTDVLLPQTSIITDLSIGNGMDETPILQSWKSSTDPSVGRFRIGLIPYPITELVTRDGDEIFWRSGPWNGSQFLGMPNGNRETFRIIYNDQEHTLNILYTVANEPLLEHYILSLNGIISLDIWDDGSRRWEIGWQSITSDCDYYGKCGPFGRCHPGDSPICSCLDGFKPKNNNEWSEGNWTSGCVRMTQLQCGNTGGKEDEFLRLEHMKLPHYITFENLAADQDDCRRTCLKTCLCLAYVYHEGIGCMTWTENLMDVQVLHADGVDLFIRLARSEASEDPKLGEGKTSNMKIIVAVIAPVATITVIVFMYCLWSLVYRSRYGRKNTNTEAVDSDVDYAEFKDLTLFKFKDLEVSTNNFSEMNKLGRGGFGPVYKGNSNGQEIAVKRLSRSSGQGLQEFMNEVLVISKLQHKNLVKLLGCCVEREEKLLVYEYMPNKSLDALLFDSHHGLQLDWKKRFNIINGICRGLLYLHRDSRLKIIHRDLKPSNILLDEDLNPKISDFGMAKIFENKQDQANTLRVVGTYGYMSPEYAMEGRFSEKSDVFSLGVLLLEIVSGRKNSSFMNIESMSLLTYAWKLWTENDMPSLIDPTILDPCFKDEILKCIQLGLLCVQEFPEDRPTISTLISMLDVNDIEDLPHPTRPGFTHRKVYSTDEILQSSQEHGGSVNNVTLTAVSGR